MPPAPRPLNLSELQFEADILHLIFHRGRNSHHCNGWWKWLSMLRRNINKLLDPTYAQELKARLEYMRTILVPICYRAFTSLIAGTHLAPMGLTLLAILARVHKVIRGQKKEKEEEEVVVEEKMVAEVSEEVKVKGTGLVVGLVTMEDFGETIRREVKEGKEEEEKMVVPEKKVAGKEVAGKEVAEKKVVKKHKAVTQELTKTSKMLKKSKDRGGISSGPIAKEEAKKERAMKKMKAMEMVSNSQLPPPSPPIIKEPPKIKSKRKAEDKEERKKKKKRKKGDEIDDLFAGLL